MPKLCLSLTGSTIAKNLAAIDRYRGLIDMAELRADYLDPEEQFHIRSFPEKAGLPTILTVRRKADGGRFEQGEGVRLVILAKGLSFAESDTRKNFAYVDIEHDLQIPAIQEAARTFGTRIIRTLHCMDGVPSNLESAWRELASNPYEIPKLAVRVKTLSDTEALLRLFGGNGMLSGAADNPGGMGSGQQRIVIGSGEYGFCTRVLAKRMGSMLVYASAVKAGLEPAAPGQLDPETYTGTYRGKQAEADWNLYGILGGTSVLGSLWPAIHNEGFSTLGLKAMYVPFPSDDLESFLRIAEILNIRGFSVTVPFKEKILPRLSSRSAEVEAIGACNTAVRGSKGWAGYNTDAYGFRRAVIEFLGTGDLKGINACIVGAGGAARAVAYTLHELGANACIINRNLTKAKRLAERYGFRWSGMTERAVELVERHNDLIIQTTSVGMDGGSPGDPIEWYEFSGREAVFETIYNPMETQLLRRAKAAGCRVTSGVGMLQAQAAAQFSLFTGLEYPERNQ
jgi:3-dehydroquinate dehydratase / shikimate dehydrogenase